VKRLVRASMGLLGVGRRVSDGNLDQPNSFSMD
jgi:hypothetical protein